MIQIHDWSEIRNSYKDALLIGNGASIEIDSRFNYKSLKKYAIERDVFTEEIKDLFEKLDTENFELVLKVVWQATNVNKALKITDTKTEEAYSLLRDFLIQIIQEIHPSYEEVQPHLPFISNYLREFKTVFSLNYDLILYWAMMYGNNENTDHVFKDCFIRMDGELLFENNWRKFRKPLYPKKRSTLVFYLHGNLILAKKLNEVEHKITTDTGATLLEAILNEWGTGRAVPLFISEGTSNQKISAIHSSYYLGTLYREVLEDCVWNINNLTIFGWSFDENDLHILKKMFDYGRSTFCKNIAISVYDSEEVYGEKVQAYCHMVKSKISEIHSLRNSNIIFFKSKGEHCWNQ